MIVDAALCTYLLADDSLTALVGQHVYRGAIPQDRMDVSPVVRLVQTAGAPIYTLGGEAGIGTARVQIDVWADTWAGAKAVFDRLRELLSTATGDLGGMTFRYVTLADVRALPEPAEDGSDNWTPRIVSQWSVRIAV